MIKKIILILLLVFVLLITQYFAIESNSDADYRVIKKAVKKGNKIKKNADVSWFKIIVTDNFTKKVKVKITLPVSLIEWLVDCTKDKHQVHFSNHCRINLKEILKTLKQSGLESIVEVCDDEETVRIWFE